MKKLVSFIAAVLMVGFLQAQTTEKKVTTKEAVKTEVKTVKPVTKEVKKVVKVKHVCTKDCKDGKHVYKAGEEGYVKPKK